MLSNCTKNLKGLIVKSIKNFENSIEVYAELPIFELVYPCCGSSTSNIHDHYALPRVLCIDEFKWISGKFKYLLLSIRYKIKETRYDELENMLINYSENLRIAYREKECLLDIIHSKDSAEIKKTQFTEWVKRNLESSVPQLVQCAKTYQHWAYEIKNSLKVPYSNDQLRE